MTKDIDKLLAEAESKQIQALKTDNIKLLEPALQIGVKAQLNLSITNI